MNRNSNENFPKLPVTRMFVVIPMYPQRPIFLTLFLVFFFSVSQNRWFVLFSFCIPFMIHAGISPVYLKFKIGGKWDYENGSLLPGTLVISSI